MQEQKRALRLDAGQFNRLIKITRATSRYPERDVLVLMLGHHTGMRVTEISRITVGDVMHASGKLREEVSLREAVTKGFRQRCVYLSSKALVYALNEYIQFRIERDIGIEHGDPRYRKLLPNQPLIYSGRGAGLSQNTKRSNHKLKETLMSKPERHLERMLLSFLSRSALETCFLKLLSLCL